MKLILPDRLRRRAFTLVEMMCCFAIMGVMATALVPAMYKAQEKARRGKCIDNMRVLAAGHLKHEEAKGGLLPLAKFWWNSAMQGQSPGYGDIPGYNGPGAWYDDDGWYYPLMPYIDEEEVLTLGDMSQPLSSAVNYGMRTHEVSIHACPSDLGLQRNQFNLATWALWRGNYVVNAGNTVYGQHDLPATCPGGSGPGCFFGGAPFGPIRLTRLKRITDGISKTLLMSEALVLPEVGDIWGGPYSSNPNAIGGQTFTGWNKPNSESPDALARVGEWIAPARDGFLDQGMPIPIAATNSRACGLGLRGPTTVEGVITPVPQQDSNGVKQQCIAARSKHPGGVNAARCNGSVSFFSDELSPRVWHALTSAWADDLMPTKVASD